MSLGRDFLAFLMCHKAWWLVPILGTLAWLAVVIVAAGGSDGQTTFRYTMF